MEEVENRWLCLIGMLLLLNACQERDTKREIEYGDIFTVELPSIMQNDRATAICYEADHFWDRVDFSDTLWLGRQEWLDLAVEEYLQLLKRDSASVRVVERLLGLLQRAGVNRVSAHRIFDAVENGLRGRGPCHDENLYERVCTAALEKNFVDAETKTRMREFLDLYKKNREGEIASDFTYTLASGKRCRMHDVEAEWLILFMGYDPGKSKTFMTTLVMLTRVYQFEGLVKKGRLKFLFLYPDPKQEYWNEALEIIPDTWIRGYDAEGTVLAERMYDLSRLPTLYLLDRDKRILAKNATWTRLTGLLPQNP